MASKVGIVKMSIYSNGLISLDITDPNGEIAGFHGVTGKGNNKPMIKAMELIRSRFDIVNKNYPESHVPTKSKWTLKGAPFPTPTLKVPTPSEMDLKLGKAPYGDKEDWWKPAAGGPGYESWECPSKTHKAKYLKLAEDNTYYCTNGQHKPKGLGKASKQPKPIEKAYASEALLAQVTSVDVKPAKSGSVVCEVGWGPGMKWCGAKAVAHASVKSNEAHDFSPVFLCKDHIDYYNANGPKASTLANSMYVCEVSTNPDQKYPVASKFWCHRLAIVGLDTVPSAQGPNFLCEKHKFFYSSYEGDSK